ncbi:MAG: leucyl aminopeptidase family protein, partial [Bacteroidota bacterium]
MICKAEGEFPQNAIQLYACPTHATEPQKWMGADAFPGIKTAWELLPEQSYRTLFGSRGEVAYLIKVDLEDKIGSIRELARKLSFEERERLTQDLAIYWTAPKERYEEFINGLLLGTYRPGRWKSDAEPHPFGGANSKLYCVGPMGSMQLSLANAAYQLSHSQLRAMDLVNAPANKKRPQDLANWAIESAEKYKYEVRVLDEAACEEEGLHALLAVNRGSEDPARFIIQEYQGVESQSNGPIVLVGKGVTFDTGGISIKGSTNLHLMKSDMGGAAAVLGTVEAAARMQLPVHLIGLVPATDNSVDALAIKPSDVIKTHSGKTVEIIDTDAEGRLILSDGLSYATKYFKPTTLIDLATLTGSSVRTFGYNCGALFSKNEQLINELRAAGTSSGERLWPLPMWEDYRADLDSDVADIKNYSGKPINGAIDAAVFLETFTNNHPRFAHLDIAGVALKSGPFGKDRLATGFGIHLLITWLISQA